MGMADQHNCLFDKQLQQPMADLKQGHIEGGNILT